MADEENLVKKFCSEIAVSSKRSVSRGNFAILQGI